MNAKLFQALVCTGAMSLFSTVSHAAPQQNNKIFKTVQLSSSAFLIVERVKEPAAPPKGTPESIPGSVPGDPSSPLSRLVNITYTLIFKQDKKEVMVDRFEFQGALDLPQGLGQSGFIFHDAALDGENLLCTFVYKYQMFLATAHVDQSGNVSGYHRGTMLGRIEQIEDASFSKDKHGRVTLKTKEGSGRGRAFQFNRYGEIFSVPAEETEQQ